MALKEKALKRLAEKLNQAGIVWAESGEWALVQLGISQDYHAFEITAADPDAADRVLTRLGMRHAEPEGSGLLASYHFDGADVLLLPPLLSADGAPLAFTEDAIGQTLTVLGQAVPVLRPEDLLLRALVRGDGRRAQKLASWLAPREKAAERLRLGASLPVSPEDREMLESLLAGN